MSEALASRSPDETLAIGRRLAGELARGGVVWLEGPLGAGKTLLAKALFGALGADPDRVTSPTFTLVNEYRGAGGLPLFHVDLYRIESPAEVDTLGLEELVDSGGVVVIEWAERLGPGWGQPHLRIEIEDRGGDERLLRVTRPALAA